MVPHCIGVEIYNLQYTTPTSEKSTIKWKVADAVFNEGRERGFHPVLYSYLARMCTYTFVRCYLQPTAML